MEKIIKNEYETGINKTKEDEIAKEYIKNANRAKIKEALKTAGFSEDGKSLDKHGFFKDAIEPANKEYFSFRIKDGGFYCSKDYKMGYEIIYCYDVNDWITISIHGYPDVTYEFSNIRVPSEIMFATINVKEKFIDFLDEKLNIIKNNLDFSNYQKIVEILK